MDRRMYGSVRVYGRLRETVLSGVRNGYRTEQTRPAAEFLLGPVQMGVRQKARAPEGEGGEAK